MFVTTPKRRARIGSGSCLSFFHVHRGLGLSGRQHHDRRKSLPALGLCWFLTSTFSFASLRRADWALSLRAMEGFWWHLCRLRSVFSRAYVNMGLGGCSPSVASANRLRT